MLSVIASFLPEPEMPEMLEDGEDGDKDESTAEGNDLAMERVSSAGNAEGGKPDTESDTVGQTEGADGMAMVPVDGEEGAEAQPSPKPPTTVS